MNDRKWNNYLLSGFWTFVLWSVAGNLASLATLDRQLLVTESIPSDLVATFTPPNDGAPGRREDAGSRPGCPAPTGSFLALVPATNIGKTAAEHPTFWLYSPYPSGSIEFILEEETSKKQIYKSTFSVQKGPGIIRYQLAETAPRLEVKKRYRWRFFFFCDPEKQADVLSVNGAIVRESLSPELQSQLQQSSPQNRVTLYGDRGFWFETLTELAQLRQTQPEDPQILAQWSELLQHPMIRLNKLVSVPLVPCCTATN